ncbi:cationic amino acid transporter 5 [Phtheirospermum japonicum]|uniref:Cationic amino acid transporter 5 n=1 Tax=Phtheirospermum japonicum TaxID=374723 RepID=A0A830CPF4_9LAMI|nr:cationic amino acid transporter 5 [Phtheirospermum japonicum]
MMMAITLLVRRYYARGITSRTNLLRLVGFLLIIIAFSMGTSAYWGLRPGGWVGYTITLPLWFFGTLGIAVMLPQERTPKVWGVPLVPWLPSLSIAINLFLMGSLGAETFIRFAVCTVIMLVYYVFFGLHATYDMAQKMKTTGSSKIPIEDDEKPSP